jgi:hypothetical protein
MIALSLSPRGQAGAGRDDSKSRDNSKRVVLRQAYPLVSF